MLNHQPAMTGEMQGLMKAAMAASGDEKGAKGGSTTAASLFPANSTNFHTGA